jgi:hypothetical protein
LKLGKADKAIRLLNLGDARAFELIDRSYCRSVHRICLRMLREPVEAEDVAQDIFACVFRQINIFQAESAFIVALPLDDEQRRYALPQKQTPACLDFFGEASTIGLQFPQLCFGGWWR